MKEGCYGKTDVVGGRIVLKEMKKERVLTKEGRLREGRMCGRKERRRKGHC